MVKICRAPDETKNSTLEATMAKTQNPTQILSNLRKAYEEEDDPKRRDLLRALIEGEKDIAAGRFESAKVVFDENPEPCSEEEGQAPSQCPT